MNSVFKKIFLFFVMMFTLYNAQDSLKVVGYRVKGTDYVDLWGR